MDKVAEEVFGACTDRILEEQLAPLALDVEEDKRELLKASLLDHVVRARAHEDRLDVHDVEARRVVVLVDRLQLQLRLLRRIASLDVEVLAYQVLDARLLRLLRHVVPQDTRRKLPLPLLIVEQVSQQPMEPKRLSLCILFYEVK